MSGPKASQRDREIGERLRQRREEIGLRQQDVAAQIGLTQAGYQKWEGGETRLTLDRLKRAAPVLMSSVEELFHGVARAEDPSMPSSATIGEIAGPKADVQNSPRERLRGQPSQTRRRLSGRDKEIGARIRKRRMEMGLSQSDLANELGISWQAVQKWEKGTSRVMASRLEWLSDLLETPLSYWLDDPKSAPSQEVSVSTYASSEEGRNLLASMQKIDDGNIRKAIIALIDAIGDALPKKAGDL